MFADGVQSQGKNTPTNFLIFTIYFLDTARKNKTALEFKKFLVKNSGLFLPGQFPNKPSSMGTESGRHA
ncbi:MAG: hypothetical protein AMJ60_07510 [Desulfobacterales bacterium SG8_35]|jgi:hypothetical protein|nr:MAG: hypothetical protein AMJ60_07510 [Desulfobacterales bacterium SG8_35]